MAGEPDDLNAVDAVDAVDAVEVLDDENGRLHDDPRIPSRAELDALYEQGAARGWDEYSARAFEYLDGRREIADERTAALARGDTETVAQLDRRHAMMDQNYIGLARGQRDRDRALVDQLSDGSLDAVAVDGVTVDGVTVDGVTVDGVTVDGVTVDGVTVDAASRHALPANEPVNEPTVAVVPQDPDWQRPSVPDDPARLRTRIAALRAQRGAEQRHSRENATTSQARRAQLAAWADDNRHGLGVASTDGHVGDEDGL